jgi:hypothetical protein
MSKRSIKKISELGMNEFGSLWGLEDPPQIHEKFGNLWFAWLAWSLTLEQAEVCLSERAAHRKLKGGRIVMPSLLSVRAMLLGYAIECVLKALWLRQGNKLVREGKYRGVTGAGDHNLLSLAEVAGFESTAIEADVLRRLSNFIRFAGRYPIAKTAYEMMPDELTEADVGFFSPREFRVAESILNKVTAQVTGKKRRVFPRRLLRVYQSR